MEPFAVKMSVKQDRHRRSLREGQAQYQQQTDSRKHTETYLWSHPLNSYDALLANPIADFDKVELWGFPIRLRGYFTVRTEMD